MKREVRTTEDGSSTIYIPDWGECYHSVHGAGNESNHIFIEAGLKFVLQKRSDIHVLEVGFGTGLNAFLSFANSTGYTLYYMGLEPHPLNDAEILQLNYPEVSGFSDLKDIFNTIHNCAWEKDCLLNTDFTLHKTMIKLQDARLPENYFDLVYFDAFAPTIQPALWQSQIFRKLNASMKTGGILVTYSSKGDVKRALLESGFKIEKLPGPKGKREFCRAEKLSG